MKHHVIRPFSTASKIDDNTSELAGYSMLTRVADALKLNSDLGLISLSDIIYTYVRDGMKIQSPVFKVYLIINP